jgi:hypothetical protein
MNMALSMVYGVTVTDLSSITVLSGQDNANTPVNTCCNARLEVTQCSHCKACKYKGGVKVV